MKEKITALLVAITILAAGAVSEFVFHSYLETEVVQAVVAAEVIMPDYVIKTADYSEPARIHPAGIVQPELPQSTQTTECLEPVEVSIGMSGETLRSCDP